jgi:GNAT superfamily N-acetyltransferase
MNDTKAHFIVRTAQPSDAPAVSDLLAASYPVLLASDYEPDLLADALPHMTRANPALLASGTYYVVEVQDTPGLLVGCGGWTLERPGAPEERVDPTHGHIRHFATHPAWIHRGVGRALFGRCVADARTIGVRIFECYATTVAEPFYRALGFKTVNHMVVLMGDGLAFPSVHMLCDLLASRP